MNAGDCLTTIHPFNVIPGLIPIQTLDIVFRSLSDEPCPFPPFARMAQSTRYGVDEFMYQSITQRFLSVFQSMA